jgi:hypothetical protein
MDVYWLEQTQADVPGADDWLSASEAIRLDHTLKEPQVLHARIATAAAEAVHRPAMSGVRRFVLRRNSRHFLAVSSLALESVDCVF